MHVAFLLSFIFAIITIALISGSKASPAGHISKNAAHLRDLVNVKSPSKPKKYKCFLVEEDADGNEVLIPVSNSPKTVRKHPNIDRRKFVYDDDAKSDAFHSNSQLTFSYAPPPPTQPPTTLKPVTVPISSSFLQTDTETFAQSIDTPPVYNEPARNLVTLPPYPNAPLVSGVERPKLKQVHLPRAHGIPAGMIRNENMVPTTIPPEVVTARRDAQNRPLVLAPEHCDQIKHYAGMYGVRDVKGWVHNNCGFAQTYLPTASCEEIDILVGSCKNV